jgi:hypothetical protein
VALRFRDICELREPVEPKAGLGQQALLNFEWMVSQLKDGGESGAAVNPWLIGTGKLAPCGFQVQANRFHGKRTSNSSKRDPLVPRQGNNPFPSKRPTGG